MMPPIPVFERPTRDYFQNNIQSCRRPAILRGIVIGDCLHKWSAQYMRDAIGSDRSVVVHESDSNRLRFLNKNFIYKTLPFGEFMDKVSEAGEVGKKYYFRALAADDPRKSASDFRKDFPEISSDFIVPDLVDDDLIFSCVLRCGSANLGLWLHYDVVDNILVQVHGRKRAILFDPEDFDYLYLKEGDKSQIFDPENVDLTQYPLFSRANPYVGEMKPGDILFIPSFWMHYMVSHDFSLAVNVFWFNLPKEIYDAKDTYGNKELQPYFRAAQGIDRALKQLDVLPVEVRRFYARMLRTKIEKYLLTTTPVSEQSEIGLPED